MCRVSSVKFKFDSIKKFEVRNLEFDLISIELNSSMENLKHSSLTKLDSITYIILFIDFYFIYS